MILLEVENNDAAEITEEEEKEERGAGGGNLSTQAQYQDANLEIQESVSEASTLSLQTITTGSSPSPTPSTSAKTLHYFQKIDDIQHRTARKLVRKVGRTNNQTNKSITNFLDNVTTAQKIKIDEALGKYIIGCTFSYCRFTIFSKFC